MRYRLELSGPFIGASFPSEGVKRHHPPDRSTRVIRAGLLRLPGAEGGEERRLRLSAEVAALEPADDADRGLHLVEVIPATAAAIEVAFESLAGERRQRALDVFGHEGHELSARQFLRFQQQPGSVSRRCPVWSRSGAPVLQVRAAEQGSSICGMETTY